MYAKKDQKLDGCDGCARHTRTCLPSIRPHDKPLAGSKNQPWYHNQRGSDKNREKLRKLLVINARLSCLEPGSRGYYMWTLDSSVMTCFLNYRERGVRVPIIDLTTSILPNNTWKQITSLIEIMWLILAIARGSSHL